MKVHNRIQLLKWSGIIKFLSAYITPNSITLAGSELAPNRFGASSPTSSEPAPNNLA